MSTRMWMSAYKSKVLLPKLRFPEYSALPEWEYKQLSDLLIYEQPNKYIVRDTIYQNSGIPVLTANKSFILGFTCEADNIYHNVPVIIFDDFTTDSKYVDFPFKVKSSAIKILTCRQNNNELRLVYELISRIRFDPAQHKRYWISQYQHMKIPLPLISEQRKIADCLSSLDDLIAGVKQKIENLKQHKQGLMQQLFPQVRETVPKLRFPEFSDATQWETVTLGERCESYSGGTPETSETTYYGGSIPFIRSAEIGRHETSIFITKKGLENSSAKTIKCGDLLVALYGANSGDTALALTNGAINQAVMCIRSSEYVPYLYHYLNVRKEWIISTYLQGGQGNLSGQIVKSIPLNIPPRDEQKKIADCLISLDDLISAELMKVETLRKHKLGLMQQLFPSLKTQ